jgi:hypothetical protein
MTSAPLARILIVDDEAANLRALCDTLRDHGYGTEGFTAGKDALGALRERPFDVLLTDLMMPGMDGVALLTAALNIDPHLVGVLMTGRGTIETAVRAMQAGALDYVLKPLKMSDLLPVLARAVVVRRLRLENLELRNTVAVHELTQAIAHTLDPHVLLEKVADAVLSQFEADEVSVMLLAEDGESLHVAAVRGEGRETLLGTRVSIGEGVSGHVATHREPVVLQGEIRETAMTPLYPRAEIRSALSMPMMTRNKLVGVLNLNYTRQPRTIPFGQIKVMSIFVNAAAAGIEAARLYEDQRRIYARYREVLYMAVDGIISIDHDQRIVLFNGGAERMFGYDPEEVLGKPLSVLLPNEVAETHHRHVEAFGQGTDQSRAMARGTPLVGRRKDGALLNLEVGISKRSENGAILYTAVVRDVTQRLEQEKRIARLNDELNQAQRMETLGRLAGGVAHDFNNLLTVIIGNCELVRGGLDPGASVGPDLAQIADAGRRAADLTRQLLAFSRRQVVSPRVLDVRAHLRALEGMLRRILPDNIDMAIASNEVLWPVHLDPSQLDQIVLNLAVNARDAMPDGGSIRIETAGATLDDEYAAAHVGVLPGDYVRLSVTDTGHGMDAETLRHAFEPFFTTKPEGKGTGLGLASVHGIVAQNHGSIHVDSELGRGTTVTVFLPRQRGAAEEPAPPPATTVQAEHETVLLVDDDDHVRRVMLRVLERLGYRVLEAPDHSVALTLCSAHEGEIHLLLTDVIMPGMGGVALSERVRALRPGISTLFMSGYAPDQVAHGNLGGEGQHHIQKPFEIGALATAIRKALDARSTATGQ